MLLTLVQLALLEVGGCLTTLCVYRCVFVFLDNCKNTLVHIGTCFRKHAAEMGSQLPKEPIVFLKPTTAYVTPDSPIKVNMNTTCILLTKTKSYIILHYKF